MRSSAPFVLAASFALALPVFASTASPGAPYHRHHRAYRRSAASSHCGEIAGHASHTVLANPASVGCHAESAQPRRAVAASSHVHARRVEVASRRANYEHPASRSRFRRAALSTLPAETQATIPTVRRIHFVPPLRGSLASLMRQNERDDAEGLTRIEDDAQLHEMEADRDLIAVPASSALRVNPDLPRDRRYCRPWTARFLADLARSHYARFHRSIQVNSAVRTVAFQRALMAINGNAAPAEGDTASPHLTGAAVDIGKKGMSLSEISWMRAWLLPLQAEGRIDVEEEFYQACFHVTVYRSYAPPAPPRLTAHRRRANTTLLAAGVH